MAMLCPFIGFLVSSHSGSGVSFSMIIYYNEIMRLGGHPKVKLVARLDRVGPCQF